MLSNNDIYIFASHGMIIPKKERMIELKSNNIFMTFTQYGTNLSNNVAYNLYHICLKNNDLKKYLFSILPLRTSIAYNSDIERKIVEYGFLEFIKKIKLKLINYIEDNKSRKHERLYMKKPDDLYTKIKFLEYEDIYVSNKFISKNFSFLETFFITINKYLYDLYRDMTKDNWRTGILFDLWWNDQLITILNNDEKLLALISNTLDTTIFDRTFYDTFRKTYDYKITIYKKDDLIPYYIFDTDLIFYGKKSKTLGRFNTGIYQSGLKKIEDFNNIEEPLYIKTDEKIDDYSKMKSNDDNCNIELYKKIRNYIYQKAIFPSEKDIKDIKCEKKSIDGNTYKKILNITTNISELITFLEKERINNNLILLTVCSYIPKTEDEKLLEYLFN